MTRSAYLPLALTAVLLAACNGPSSADVSGTDVDMNADGTMEITTDDGTMTTSAEVPANWPKDVLVYADAKVMASADVNPQTGAPGMMLMLETTDDVESVKTAYTTALTGAGWKIEGTANYGGSTVIAATKDGQTTGISITDSAGKTMITIGVEAAAE